MVNFINRNNQIMNQYEYQPLNRTNQRTMSSPNVGGRNQMGGMGMPQQSFQQPFNQVPQFDENMGGMNGFNNPQMDHNQIPIHLQVPMNNTFSFGAPNNQNPELNMNPQSQYQDPYMMQNNIPMNNVSSNQMNNPQLNTPNNVGLSISYKNYQIDGDSKKQKVMEYGNELRRQMEEDKRKKDYEREKKKQEDLEEEMRVKREMELMKFQEEREKDKKKMDMDRLHFENQALRDQYVVSKNKKKLNEQEKNNQGGDQNSNNQNNNKFNQNQNTNQNYPIQDENGHAEDVELRVSINNEVMRLRNNIVEQQNVLLKQINDLKTETQSANLQRYEVMKEFNVLKEELARQRDDEEMRRKYVYDVIVDNNNKVNTVYNNSKLPDVDPEEFRVELPKPKNHQKNVKNFHYEDTIKYPNRITQVPNLDELKEVPFQATSRFIDVDTHNVVDGLNIYENKKQDLELNKVRNKGYELDEDFGALRSFYRNKSNIIDKDDDSLIDNKYLRSQRNLNKPIENHNLFLTDNRRTRTPAKTPEPFNNGVDFKAKLRKEKEEAHTFNQFVNNDLDYNKQVLQDDTLSINQIYNKNMERLRFLNNLEDNIPSLNTNELHKLENLIDNYKGDGTKLDNFVEKSKVKKGETFDDFLSKLNNIRSNKYEEKEYSY